MDFKGEALWAAVGGVITLALREWFRKGKTKADARKTEVEADQLEQNAALQLMKSAIEVTEGRMTAMSEDVRGLRSQIAVMQGENDRLRQHVADCDKDRRQLHEKVETLETAVIEIKRAQSPEQGD